MKKNRLKCKCTPLAELWFNFLCGAWVAWRADYNGRSNMVRGSIGLSTTIGLVRSAGLSCPSLCCPPIPSSPSPLLSCFIKKLITIISDKGFRTHECVSPDQFSECRHILTPEQRERDSTVVVMMILARKTVRRSEGKLCWSSLLVILHVGCILYLIREY